MQSFSLPPQSVMNKREQLINNALELFYINGIHAVGINEILSSSGVAKKTLYHHFDSKDTLILACIEERNNRFMHWLTTRCASAKTVTAFIEVFFTALDDWINNKAEKLGDFNGCFFVNVSAEYNDESNPIYLQCLHHKYQVKCFVEQKLNSLIQVSKSEEGVDDFNKGVKRDNVKVSLLTDCLTLLKEGCINGAFVMGDKHSAIKAKNIALSFLLAH